MKPDISTGNLFESIFGLATIAVIGNAVGKLLRYSINLVIARGLGAKAVGLFAIGLIVVKISSQIAQAGLHKGAEKYVSIYHSSDDQQRLDGVLIITFVIPVILGTVIALLIILRFEFLSTYFNTSIVQSAKLFAVAIPFYAAMIVGMFATRGFKETKYSVYIYDFAQSGAAILLVAAAIYITATVESAIIVYTVSVIFGAVVSIYFLRKLGGFRLFRTATYEYREILSFSLPLFFVSLASYTSSWADILLLSVFETPASVGIYQVVFETALLLTTVLIAVNTIFPSTAAELYASNSHEQLEQLFTVITKWVFTITLLAAVFLLIFSSEVLSIFGETFLAGTLALQVLVMGKAVEAMVGPVGNLLVMTNNEQLETLNSIVFLAINVTGNWVLIQEFGLLGAAVATSGSYIVINLLRLLEVRWIHGFTPYDRSYWKGIVAVGCAAMVMGIISYLSAGILLAVIGGFVGTVLAAIVIIVLGIDDQDSILIESIR